MRCTGTKTKQVAEACLIALFVAAIGAPVARQLYGYARPSGRSVENRKLAVMPSLELSSRGLREYRGKFESFFNDHFGFRTELIAALGQMKMKLLGMSSSSNVIVGKDGWLFYAPEPLGNDYTSQRPFRPDELARWLRVARARRNWLAQRGIHYLIVIAPDKQTVYPEYLPTAIRARQAGGRLEAAGRLDQLVSALQAAEVCCVDLRRCLREAKGQGPLYYRTDTHWNCRAALAAYGNIFEALCSWWPRMRPLPAGDFQVDITEQPVGDLVRLLGIRSVPSEHYFHFVHSSGAAVVTAMRAPVADTMQIPTVITEHPNKALPRLVMFRDSFADELVPYLSEHFSRAVCVGQLRPTFDPALVEREKPALVIQEMVERKLQEVAPMGSAGLCPRESDWQPCTTKCE